MDRFVWFLGGLLLIFYALNLIPPQVQVVMFIVGVLVVGVPHGAADLLVGLQNAKEDQRVQTQWWFIAGYLAKLIVFGGLFYLFPTAALILFFVMAAFHFGETDLNKFDTASVTGKVFILSYGLLIIGFVLLFHLQEANPLLTSLGANAIDLQVIGWLEQRKEFFLSLLLIFFFSSVFVHFLIHPGDAKDQGIFLWRLIALLGLLYWLPLLLGFFFYFVVWHSLISLANIVGYLQKGSSARLQKITKTMFFYSMATFTGIAALCAMFKTVLTEQMMISVAFAALLVLTAPHMMVMHGMYKHLRQPFFKEMRGL